MSSYFELKISINPEIEEIISDIFFTHFDCEGVLLEEQVYKDLKMTSTTRGILKVFLANCPQNTKEILDKERKILKTRGFSDLELGSWDFEIEEKENLDWSQKWKENWTVTKITDKITVVPSWIEYQQGENEIILTIDPGCAFGTGTHQTTQLCMKALEKYLSKNDKVADVGMGSGILSILAMKLGASSVYGCDIDETVINVAKKNAEINSVKCEFELNTADKITEKYDFVCANILHNVLAEIMPDLKNLLKVDGYLSLSGILEEKKDIVIDAIEKNNLQIIDTLSQDQWISYVVKL